MTLTTHVLEEFRDTQKDKMDTEWTHGAIGTGTTAPTVSDTALESEVLRKARQETSTTSDSRTVSLWIGSTEANGNTISELGFFDASSGGNLKGRWTFSGISKTSDIELWFDVTVTFNMSES